MEDVHRHPFHQFAEQLSTFLEFSTLFALAYIIKELLLIPLMSIGLGCAGSWQCLKGWPPVIKEIAAVCIAPCSVVIIAIGTLLFTSFWYAMSFGVELDNFANGTAEYRQKCWRGLLFGGKDR